jgi:plasmid maintenance system killer protein
MTFGTTTFGNFHRRKYIAKVKARKRAQANLQEELRRELQMIRSAYLRKAEKLFAAGLAPNEVASVLSGEIVE